MCDRQWCPEKNSRDSSENMYVGLQNGWDMVLVEVGCPLVLYDIYSIYMADNIVASEIRRMSVV